MRVEGVGFLELADDSVYVTGLFAEGFGVPFAAPGGEKIAAVHMDGTGETGNRIGDGVNDVVAERLGVLFAKGAGAGGFEFTRWGTGDAAPEDVVFPASVNADDGPHLVIVGEERHVRAPDDIEDGEGIGAEEGLDAGLGGFAERFEDAGGIGDGARGEIANVRKGRVLRQGGTAIVDEGIQFKHGICLLAERGIAPHPMSRRKV